MSRLDERVYRQLAEHGETPIVLLQRRLELGEEVVEAVERLRALGYVVGNPPDARRPDQIFQGHIRAHEAELFATRARVGELQELYDRASRPAARGPVALLTSRTQLKEAMDDLELNAERELMKFITAPYSRLGEVHAPDDRARRDSAGTLRIPRRRVIIEQTVVDDDKALDGIRNALLLPNSESRIAVNLPYKLIIADGERALVPAYPRDHPDKLSTHLIQGGNEIIAHTMVFEQCWAMATPLSADSSRFSTELSAEDRQILQLLIGGATNESIARLLDVHVRTVGRRLTELRERAGVTSRAALISHAAREWML
ncbi:helix-turn-helix transcriptional regulator [Nonomuraea lactucae]|uniref:helix-turn-helix transcriptional regulator n=1 Tax=Nonomuraea lactucae TaxID=2249762 RepID=UPI000DE55133|nr:helix-turn-helix transcriptional regulator [Nonomuraea lactucae]